MADVYATIADADRPTQERLAAVIEQRAADPTYAALVQAHLSRLSLPPGARVLEIGCGTGAFTRMLAARPNVGHALGVDPSPVFIDHARRLAGTGNASFEIGDGRALPLPDASFDLVAVHTTLSHVPHAERLLGEARRVLVDSGLLAVFDGDYAGVDVAARRSDPLQGCVEAFLRHFVHDPWIVRRLGDVLHASGFAKPPLQGYGYLESPRAGYLASWIDRGADALLQEGAVDAATADALKGEARRRSEAGRWYGFIPFAGAVAGKR